MIAILRRTVIIFIAGFVVLFALRIGYGYWDQPNGQPVARAANTFGTSRNWKFAGGLRNYASAKVKVSRSQLPGGAIGGGVDQKYEKVANVGLTSGEFDRDEDNVRTHIKSNGALIQFEQRQGLKGHRLLRLAIGVSPDKFDSFVEKIQTFGKLSQLTINKSDKTNEYRDLQAKRASLDKSRTALAELKKREGDIRSMVELEKQVLALEQQIQALGVNLGDFDSENEFVTVKVLLAETQKSILRTLSFVARAFAAFVWTVQFYALLWVALAACAVAVLAGIFVIRLALKMLADADHATQKG
ncbi:MAG TPA: DUF4349 domain-containing protein [Hyphomicrobiaceae bacterium]|nr:DUF4349 domain-containing protein [Hyphomicrobiaceae bacterium]